MRKGCSKIIAMLCFAFYLLFGFINSGNFGFCFGNEHDSHFGLIIAGYEVCCDDEKNVIQNNQNQASFHCDCNDVGITPIVVSQIQSSIINLIHLQKAMTLVNVSPFICNLDYLSILKSYFICYKETPPDLISKNSEIIKSSIVLLI